MVRNTTSSSRINVCAMIGQDFVRSLTAFNGAGVGAAAAMEATSSSLSSSSSSATAAAALANRVNVMEVAAGKAADGQSEPPSPQMLEVRIRQVSGEDHVQIVKLFQVSELGEH